MGLNWSAIPAESSAGRLLRWILNLIPHGLPVPILQGPARGRWWVVGAGPHGYWLGSYEWEYQKALCRYISPGSVVFDVGANAGFYTLLASALTGSEGAVVAFEPLPRNLVLVKKHLALNRIQNVRLIEGAVCRRPGTTLFAAGAGPSCGKVDRQGDLRVAAVSLDELWLAGEIPMPDVIKMDIEGGEQEALLGAQQMLSSGRPTLLLATHGVEIHKHCCEILRSLGYKLTPATGAGEVETSYEIIASPRG